jgi:hypothetical protein
MTFNLEHYLSIIDLNIDVNYFNKYFYKSKNINVGSYHLSASTGSGFLLSKFIFYIFSVFVYF